LAIFLYLYQSCGEASLKCLDEKLFPKVDCERLAAMARKRECLMIFERMPFSPSSSFLAKGRHLTTSKECECSDEGAREWMQYEKYLEKGDTIIKRKGELVFSIHKKDTILNFNWECQGKIYK
jgi:hypothetical protein